MTEWLILLGVVLVTGFIVVALLRVAPAHEKEMNNAFEELAMRRGLRYQAEDDGRARDFAEDFDGIGELHSASAHGPHPRDVVSGVLDGQRIFVFRRDRQRSEGPATDWFVAGLDVKNPIADRCSVHFSRRGSDTEATCLVDPIVKELEIGAFNVVVRALDPSSAGRLLEDQVLEELAGHAEQLALPAELQVRGTRIIAYPADRDTTISHANDLGRLLGFVQRTARIAGSRTRRR